MVLANNFKIPLHGIKIFEALGDSGETQFIFLCINFKFFSLHNKSMKKYLLEVFLQHCL